MQNFIQIQTGAYVAISSIDYAEPDGSGQMKITTSRGKFLVNKTDFNKAAGITAPAPKKRVNKKS